MVDLKPGTKESSRLRTDVLQTGNGVDITEKMKDHDSSASSKMRTDVFQTDNGVDTSEKMDVEDNSDTGRIASDIMNDRGSNSMSRLRTCLCSGFRKP